MSSIQEILKTALERKQKSLSEYESKQIISHYGIPAVREILVQDWNTANDAASKIGFPVVLKVCSSEVTHKTEKNLIEVNIRDESSFQKAFTRLKAEADKYEGTLLIQEMVKGSRELVAGMVRDPQFGPCVMFGMGGIFTEILQDVTFRVAPFEMGDALEMMGEIKGHKILDTVRGMDEVDKELLGRSLIALGKIGLDHDEIQEIDINPMIIQGKIPVAVDALVVLKGL